MTSWEILGCCTTTMSLVGQVGLNRKRVWSLIADLTGKTTEATNLTMFDARTGKFASWMNGTSPSTPSSKSWLPRPKASYFTRLANFKMASYLKTEYLFSFYWTHWKFNVWYPVAFLDGCWTKLVYKVRGINALLTPIGICAVPEQILDQNGQST